MIDWRDEPDDVALKAHTTNNFWPLTSRYEEYCSTSCQLKSERNNPAIATRYDSFEIDRLADTVSEHGAALIWVFIVL